MTIAELNKKMARMTPEERFMFATGVHATAAAQMAQMAGRNSLSYPEGMTIVADWYENNVETVNDKF